MSYSASAAGAASGRGNEGYHSFGDEDERTASKLKSSAAVNENEDDTSGDLALAMALSREENDDAVGFSKDTERDEELALALAMTMEEGSGYEDVIPPPPPPRAGPAQSQQKEVPLEKQTVNSNAGAQSMFDRIMSSFAPFRRRTSSTEKLEARRARVERFKEKRARQATLLLNVMEVLVPDFLPTENFLIMKPDGTVSKIHLPLAHQHPPFYITFEGEPLMKAAPRILDEQEQNTAFVDYYRFDPIEIETEVDIIPGPRTLGGLELVSQPEGVFVKWGVFPLPPSRKDRGDVEEDEYDIDDAELDEYHDILETQQLVCAGDLIVQVGDAPTTSLEALRSSLASIPIGSKVLVRVLRKPPPKVRCPMGHLLLLDDPRASLEAECDSCKASFGRHHCVQCGFSLCWPCHQLIYAHSKARLPRPVNNDHEFTMASRSTRVTFTDADVGLNVLIYWYTTAEWWISQIESFDPIKGHTVVYEERNGKKCRETIPDFSVREYHILSHCVVFDWEQAEHSEKPPASELAEGESGEEFGSSSKREVAEPQLLDMNFSYGEEEKSSGVDDDLFGLNTQNMPGAFSARAIMPQTTFTDLDSLKGTHTPSHLEVSDQASSHWDMMITQSQVKAEPLNKNDMNSAGDTVAVSEEEAAILNDLLGEAEGEDPP